MKQNEVMINNIYTLYTLLSFFMLENYKLIVKQIKYGLSTPH